LHFHVVRSRPSGEAMLPLGGVGIPFTIDLQQIKRGKLHGRD
jgi:hypothetical protein